MVVQGESVDELWKKFSEDMLTVVWTILARRLYVDEEDIPFGVDLRTHDRIRMTDKDVMAIASIIEGPELFGDIGLTQADLDQFSTLDSVIEIVSCRLIEKAAAECSG